MPKYKNLQDFKDLIPRNEGFGNEYERLEELKAQLDSDLSRHKVFVEDDLYVEVKPRDEEARVSFSIGNHAYEISGGVYCIIGYGDSGKTTLALKIAEETYKDSVLITFGEAPVKINSDKVKTVDLTVYNHKVDFLTFNEILNDYGSVLIVDSFDFLMPYNKGFGIEGNGIPKRPFQTIWALDKACQKAGVIVFAIIPVDDRRTEALERIYEKVKIKTSGVFIPKIAINRVKYSIRFDHRSKSRISDTETEMMTFYEKQKRKNLYI